jgi:7-carboxy-7-deazaguanine synthase
LMKILCDADYLVSLETSGALDIGSVDARVMKVMDIKTPASGEESKNLWKNLEHVNAKDEIKFVLCNEDDYGWSRKMLTQHALTEKCEVLFSPAQGQLSPGDLADWILRDHLPVRMQLQLHKILWGNVAGR